MPLTLAKRTDGYWIVGLEDDGRPLDCGPYSSKAEAEDDRRGLERSAKYEDRKGFVTADSIRTRQKKELFT